MGAFSALSKIAFLFYWFFSVHSLRPNLWMNRSRQARIWQSKGQESKESISTLKIPSTAWKFPQAWPFPPDMLDRLSDFTATDTGADFISSSIIEHIKKFIKPTDKVLFIGASDWDKNLISTSFPSSEFVMVGDVLNGEADLPGATASFDKFVLFAGVELIIDPISLFKDVWRIMKPGGQGFVCFSSMLRIPVDSHPVKMWNTMSDEQKIWIAGSYFHFAAGEAFENLEGYDILGNTGDTPMVFDRKGGSSDALNATAFVVQAMKSPLPTLDSCDQDIERAAEYIKKTIVGMKYLDNEAVQLLSYRLASKYVNASSVDDKSAVLHSVEKLPSIYTILREVKEIVLPSPVKAMLASAMLKQWTGVVEQDRALRMGLGLQEPDDQFWRPVSQSTKNVPPRKKIFFLADLVPMFGNEEHTEALKQLPLLMQEALQLLEERADAVPVEARQSFVTDLVVSDYLLAANPSTTRVLKFLQETTIEELLFMLNAF